MVRMAEHLAVRLSPKPVSSVCLFPHIGVAASDSGEADSFSSDDDADLSPNSPDEIGQFLFMQLLAFLFYIQDLCFLSFQYL